MEDEKLQGVDGDKLIQERLDAIDLKLGKLMDLFGDLSSLIGSINLSGPVLKQSDRSDRSDLINQSSGSDRSDLIRAHASKDYSNFVSYCLANGVDPTYYDLKAIDRNITWVMANQDKISNPKAYINRILSSAPPRIGFAPGGSISRPNPSKYDDAVVEGPVTQVYGYPVEELDELIPYIDNRTFGQIKTALGIGAVMFKSYEEVMGNSAKLRVLIAEGKKRGIL